MSEQTIWARLRAAGMTEAGAAGLMGNMSAESAMRPDNVQDGYGWSDGDYTAAVDSGTYSDFVHDAVGYGLCQWTYFSRKAALLACAAERGVSIGNGDMQTDFTVRELRSDYAELWAYLCRTDDWYEAAERVCREYERPAVCNVAARAGYAYDCFKRFAGSEPGISVEAAAESVEPPPSARWTADMPAMATLCQGFGGEQVTLLQRLLLSWGYTVTVTGIFDAETDTAVRAFQADNNLESDGIVGRMTWTALLAG